jgi:hypothetical protein
LRWGRIGIEFGGSLWRPAIFTGFLLTGTDHKVDLVTPAKGPDLMLSIESSNPKVFIPGDIVTRRACALRELEPSAVVEDQYQVNSKWRKLMMRMPLADVIKGCDSEPEQLSAIYERFSKWCGVLFSDDELEQAFLQAWPPK